MMTASKRRAAEIPAEVEIRNAGEDRDSVTRVGGLL